MSTNQNLPPSVLGVRRRESSLQLEPRKKPSVLTLTSILYSMQSIRRAPNPLVHHGRHFGRTVHALCSVKQLLRNCIPRLDDIDGVDEEEDRVISIEFVMFCYLFLFDFTECQGPAGVPGIPVTPSDDSRARRPPFE